MNRRDAVRALALLPFSGSLFAQKKRMGLSRIVKPKRLAVGDAVAVIAPSSGVSTQTFDRSIENLKDLGFDPRPGRFARGSRGFLSGTDEERLHDLHWAFSDKEIKGIWCVRGGSGSPRLLPNVDYDIIRKNPKVFIGFSDITALHLAIFQSTGLVTFHGPVASSEFSPYTRQNILKTVMTATDPYRIDISDFNEQQVSELFRSSVITPGKCRGPLIGGNLSLIGALAGTPFALKDVRGKILFLEDVNEPPYKVDRLLTQLRQTIELKSVTGIALGIFSSGDPAREASATALIAVLRDRLGDLRVPVIYGLSFGHIRDNFTLPIGVNAELDTSTRSLTLLERAVV